VLRAARHGLPLILAVIGGRPQRFTAHVDLFHRALQESGHAPQPVGQHSLGLVADTDEEAKEVFWPRYREIRDRIGALRGWPPVRRTEFDAEIEHGSLYIGSPETVARKIAGAMRGLDVARFDLLYTAGSQPISARLRAVELYGSKVIPMVRDILAG
jgi:alkanesulfonate monooxygenase SsuD/methylene tetrahydromethanopterin reductase-like flavin-dependent oxidoreductase (luciferase family)